MSTSMGLTELSGHLPGVALCAARLVPIAWLTPLLGGPMVPSVVRLALIASIALSLHFAASSGAASVNEASSRQLILLAARESGVGILLGLLLALPFEAARMGGRWIDTFRGTFAEAASPGLGTQESTDSQMFHLAMVALAAEGGLLTTLLGAVFTSYRWLPLSVMLPTESSVLFIARSLTAAMVIGLCLSAPVIVCCFVLDWTSSFLVRIAPSLRGLEPAGPLKVLCCGILVWLTLGPITRRLLDWAGDILASIQFIEVA